MLATVLLTCSGCPFDNGNVVELLPVSGEVLMDGKPFPGAKVLFIPQNKELGSRFAMSYAITDSDGKFTLRISDENMGAFAGTHYVMISKPLKEGKLVEGNSDEGNLGENKKDSVFDFGYLESGLDVDETIKTNSDQVPVYYNYQTELTFEVSPGQENVTFELSSIDPLLK